MQLDLYKTHLTAITEEHKINVQKSKDAEKSVSNTG
jgi:hypothetical protein